MKFTYNVLPKLF